MEGANTGLVWGVTTILEASAGLVWGVTTMEGGEYWDSVGGGLPPYRGRVQG